MSVAWSVSWRRQRRPIGPDAASLRRSIYHKGAATRIDLVGLLALGQRGRRRPDFVALVADVASDVMTVEVDPPGYVSESDADWLISQLGDGSRASLPRRVRGAQIRTRPRCQRALRAHRLRVREVERAILTGRRGAARRRRPRAGNRHRRGRRGAARRLLSPRPQARGAACRPRGGRSAVRHRPRHRHRAQRPLLPRVLRPRRRQLPRSAPPSSPFPRARRRWPRSAKWTSA